MIRSSLGLVCLSAALFVSGCAVGRRSFDLPVAAPIAPASASRGTFAITQVDDVRQFENKPGDPSTPSIDGDVNELSATQRSTFIGRQRGGYGKALGDITLPAGQTVQTKMVQLLTASLQQSGYSVIPSGQADNTATVEIRKFWAWMTPGFIALSFEAHLECKVVVTHGGRQAVLEVKGYALNHGQVLKNKNWQESYEAAFEDFQRDFQQQLKDNGL